MTKALVTGGLGFIGSGLVKGLLAKGYEVTVFDNGYRGSHENLKAELGDIKLITGDIRDAESVSAACKGQEVVFHLAFINGTENFYERPDLVLDVGVAGNLAMIKAALQQDVTQFVYASSSEIYQTAGVIPTPENVPGLVPDVLNPRYSYGGAKLIGELMTLHMLKDSVRTQIFRPHNVYGPAMGFEHVIPQLTQKIHAAIKRTSSDDVAIEIQGSGQETRAFCYIDDAVDGIVRVAQFGEHKGIYHVGCDQEVTIRHLAEQIAKYAGLRNIGINSSSLTAGSTLRRCPDISKLQSLGYVSAHDLQQGLEKTVPWYVDHFNQQG